MTEGQARDDGGKTEGQARDDGGSIIRHPGLDPGSNCKNELNSCDVFHNTCVLHQNERIGL
jgi:hypothetical protein